MTIRKTANIFLLGLILLYACCSACAQGTQNGAQNAETPPKANGKPTSAAAETSKFNRPSGFVNDSSGILSQTDKNEIENVLSQLKEKAQIDIAIAIIDSTDGKSIFDHSLALAREWKIGAKNGGALLVVAVKDRKWHIQIDKRLETDLSNEEVKNIGEVMLPDFREDKHADGIKKCVEKMIAVLAQKQHFEPIKFLNPKQ